MLAEDLQHIAGVPWHVDFSQDLFFASPQGCLVGRGVADVLADGPEALSLRAARLLAQSGRPDAVLAGAIPFDARQPARLYIPQEVWRGAPLDATVAAQSAVVRNTSVNQRLQPTPAEFEAMVARAVTLFGPDLSKLVLSRTLEIELDRTLDVDAVLTRLLRQNRQGYTFAIPALAGQDPDAGRGLIGASPELLVRRQGRRVIVNPLAGSAARQADAVADAEAGQALLASAKDRHEHAIVIDDVVRGLRSLCRSLTIPDGPSLVATDALWHLSTRIEGEVADPEISSLDLALALHPTPAVCGQPTRAAFDAIAGLEPTPRGLYAGFTGWCDASGDGEWAVTLRCATWRDHAIRLHAGAGIVAGSVPASERDETATKFRTMLNGLGLA